LPFSKPCSEEYGRLFCLLWDLRQTGNGIRVCYATSIFDDANVILVPLLPGFECPQTGRKDRIRRCVHRGLGISIVAYLIMTAFSEVCPAMIIGLVMNSIGLVPLQAALLRDCGRCRLFGVLEYGSSRASFGVQSDGCGGWESPLRWLPGPSR
jgi:hypothetical protein